MAGGRLRVAADAAAHEVLGAALQLVASVLARGQQIRGAAGELAIVALFRIRRIEIGRVVDETARDAWRRPERSERRVDQLRGRYPVPLKPLHFLRVLKRREDGAP